MTVTQTTPPARDQVPTGHGSTPEAGDLSDVDLLYSDVEDDLRSSVRDLLADRCSWLSVLESVTAARQDDTPGAVVDEALWRSVAEQLGLAGLSVAEEAGGAGAGPREVAVVLEELGRSVAPVPYLGTAAVSAAVLGALPSGPVVQDLLGRLAGGAVTTVVLPQSAAAPLAGEPVPTSSVQVETGQGDQATLRGVVRSVADAVGAQALLVPAVDGLYLVEVADGVSIEVVRSLDPTRPVADVTFDGAVGVRLADGPAAAGAVQAGLTAGAALLASEQLGLATWCLEETCSYLATRYQFGRPIATFQALRHRLADLWTEITQARAVARYAAECLASGSPDTAVAASLAQAVCAPVALKAAEECVQMHGGIGFTWEHPAHLYLKRASASAIAFGTAEYHRRRLASLVDLPPTA